jgi:hypothetical protein
MDGLADYSEGGVGGNWFRERAVEVNTNAPHYDGAHRGIPPTRTPPPPPPTIKGRMVGGGGVQYHLSVIDLSTFFFVVDLSTPFTHRVLVTLYHKKLRITSFCGFFALLPFSFCHQGVRTQHF